MPTTYLFVGPTLPDAEDVTRGSAVKILPPVAAGDLLAMRLERGDVVAIIDGYFHQRRAIPHKEIMEVVRGGAGVLGASSMGALRAAELEPFGMRGVGGIFADYRSGVLQADDEVTLVHGTAEDGYPHMSEPLVNIRATLDGAMNAGLCSTDQLRAVVEDLSGITYRDRNYSELGRSMSRVGIPAASAKVMVEYCREHPVDRKREDALELVGLLRAGESAHEGVFPDPEPTFYLQGWKTEARNASARDAHCLAQILAPDYPAFHEETVLNWIVNCCQRECSRSPVQTVAGGRPAELAVQHGAHKGLYAPEPDGLAFLPQWTTAHERATLTDTELMSKFLVRSCRIRPGVVHTELLSGAFRRLAAYERAVSLVSRVRELNESARTYRPDFDHRRIAAHQVAAWLAERWGRPVDELALASHDRGFDSVESMIAAAREVYLPARCDTDVRSYALSQ
ncbi:TfuA-like protein [Streptomyces sp. NBC_00829]|uniref:TfuA-like protein n=1 Tax=Streptomyces sp. NBC_00829 TaxID=2903679 RepID=UPI00387012DA|nr:TfuA-like protein [Streptomyces sp. NBC_00829]